MDKKVAQALLESLAERATLDKTLGSISSMELQALRISIQALEDTEAASVVAVVPPIPSLESAAVDDKKPTLVLNCLSSSRESDSTLLCLDFGTAMSKAFASDRNGEKIFLEIGRAAGAEGYMIPSSVFISKDGNAYFGFEAIDKSQDLVETGRERLDSIKQWLSLRSDGDLDDQLLLPAMNPTSTQLTEGDMLRIYLAYFTDMVGLAASSIESDGRALGRYLKRRFARPCWSAEKQELWANNLMRTMLAQAQVLADTFSGQWAHGIDVNVLKSAIEEVKQVEQLPYDLLIDGIPEPVAVAAGAFVDSDNLREPFIVVDAGAGTTDFGLFIYSKLANREEHRIFQVPGTVTGLKQAGDTVDRMLWKFILNREGIDPEGSSGRAIVVDLRRRIRSYKEVLFKTGTLDYVLADETLGHITLDEFLDQQMVQRFSAELEKGFTKVLEQLPESWLRMLSKFNVRLNVVLTGGSSTLPMIQALASGPIQVRGYQIARKAIDPKPEWVGDSSSNVDELYPQLAVAIGGAEPDLPETVLAPEEFAGA